MSRKELPLPPEYIAPFDLETFTPPFPKAPDRWLSRYQFRPRAIGVYCGGRGGGGPQLADRRDDRSAFRPRPWSCPWAPPMHSVDGCAARTGTTCGTGLTYTEAVEESSYDEK